MTTYITIKDVRDTLNNHARTHLIPQRWLYRQIQEEHLSGDEAYLKFTQPSNELVNCNRRVPKPLTPLETMTYCQEEYGTSVTKVIVYWSELGYTRARVAYWLKTSMTVISSLITKYRLKVNWTRVDGVAGTTANFTFKGERISIAEFGRRYFLSPSELTTMMHGRPVEEVEKIMKEIAEKREKDPVRRFLTMPLVSRTKA